MLDIVADADFLARVEAVGSDLRDHLATLPSRFPSVVAEVRGAGLMLGLRCVVPNRLLVTSLIDSGLLSIPAGDNVVRLLPPLIIGDEEAGEAFRIIEHACAELVTKAA